jgi:hypothetical protein
MRCAPGRSSIVIDDRLALGSYLLALTCSGIRADKKDEELFFVDSKNKAINHEAATVADHKKSLEDALNDLRCFRNLGPDVNSEPALLRNCPQKKVDSKRSARRADADARTKRKPIKSAAKKEKKSNDNRFEFVHDLWNTALSPEINHTNEYFLRTTKKIMPKVCPTCY